MRIFLFFIFLFNFVTANEIINTTLFSDKNISAMEKNKTNETNKTIDVSNTIINISLPEVDEENLTNDSIQTIDDNSINIAIVINKKKFFKYLPSLINSIDAYLLHKDIDFEIKVFNEDENLTSLNEITQDYDDIFLYSSDVNVLHKLAKYPDNNFYLPIINKNQVNFNVSNNIFFGGLNFKQQITKLKKYIHGKTYLIKENSMLSNVTTKVERSLFHYAQILKYPFNYRRMARSLNYSSVFLNTKVVHTAQILSNFTFNQIQPRLILSSQINYNPLLFSIATPQDYKKLIVANSLLSFNIRLLDANMNLGSDLKFNWLNYTTSALLNKAYINEIDEYPYFLNDFNLYILDNQVEYKTKLYKIFRNGFIEIR